MTDQPPNVYEGLFLFPQAQAGDLEAAVDHVKDILGKAEAEVISFRKWDERRLSYEIKGNKRGVYFLFYFRARPDALIVIERSCNLSEHLLRTLITRAEHLTQEQIEAADGSAELADEIKREQEKTAGTGSAKADKAAGEEQKEKEPVTVETEAATKDAAAAVEP